MTVERAAKPQEETRWVVWVDGRRVTTFEDETDAVQYVAQWRACLGGRIWAAPDE